jgi:DNA mismatch repair protein MutS2
MKTVGILVLMVQSGIHVPAAPDSEFPLFTKLYVDIGDDQSIENDLSTFTSHISRIKEILSTADDHSLVLIDEIGAGTDPVEGGALAAAILNQLTKVGAFTVATTHQVALKAFAYETEGMENSAMEFDQNSLLPTYRFRVGVPGSSYALEIAKRLGISSSLISEAEAMAGDQKSHLEKLILDLENRSQALSKQIEVIDAEKLQLNELTRNYETKLKGLQQELKLIKSKAVEEAKAIITKANSVIERSVKEIKQQQAEKTAIREAKREIRDLEVEISLAERALGEIETGAEDKNVGMMKGSFVRLKTSSQVGAVVQAPDANGLLQVAFDNLKMRVHLNDVILLKEQPTTSRSSVPFFTEGKPQREIDVRGLYGDEAIEAVDKFIDNATLTGLHRVDIIHGKGSGVLRKKISAYLILDKRIKSHRLGEWNEGGAGVTVIELRD